MVVEDGGQNRIHLGEPLALVFEGSWAERQGGRAAGDRAAPVTACVLRGSRLLNQSRVLGPQQPVVTQGRIPSLKSPAAHLFRQERAM